MRHVFVQLYRDGLIYRDLRMVNWCPFCRTAISDVESEFASRTASCTEIDYPIASSDRRVTVANHAARRCSATPRWQCTR